MTKKTRKTRRKASLDEVAPRRVPPACTGTVKPEEVEVAEADVVLLRRTLDPLAVQLFTSAEESGVAAACRLVADFFRTSQPAAPLARAFPVAASGGFQATSQSADALGVRDFTDTCRMHSADYEVTALARAVMRSGVLDGLVLHLVTGVTDEVDSARSGRRFHIHTARRTPETVIAACIAIRALTSRLGSKCNLTVRSRDFKPEGTRREIVQTPLDLLLWMRLLDGLRPPREEPAALLHLCEAMVRSQKL
jgi:hypothetical protein